MSDAPRRTLTQRLRDYWSPKDRLQASPLKPEFDTTRDALTKAQHRDLDKPEDQLRRENTAYYVRMLRERGPIPVKRAGMSTQVAAYLRDEDMDRRDRGDAGRGDIGSKGLKVLTDHSKPRIKPPASVARRVDQAAFEGRWLRTQCNAALGAAKTPSHTQDTPTCSRRSGGPEPSL